ncbi:MAG: hypothetical protein Q8P53_02865 [Candidatus Shapirobacteria bacterium]|nr:hypothetical protein [Candidatus Shapirobacteria bacterium]
MNKKTRIALFFGGKVSQHLMMIKRAAKKLGVVLDLVSYNEVCFDTDFGEVKLRRKKNIKDYDVLFFRTTGKHWEEVNLILDSVKNPSVAAATSPLDKGEKYKTPVVVDPLVLKGRPSDTCKAYQMLVMKRAGIDVPKTVYGSLWYLYEFMKETEQKNPSVAAATSPLDKGEKYFFTFPVILKGSGGDRGTRVFKANNLAELEKLVMDLRKSETEEGRRYMLQEYIENDGDYRVLVLGKKVLGVIKRSAPKNHFLNNYSAGGRVEVAKLPKEIEDLAVKAAEVCGLWVAGVDVAFRNYDINKPVIWEVNKGPQFKGFMKATGIDVPAEIVKFLVGLKK